MGSNAPSFFHALREIARLPGPESLNLFRCNIEQFRPISNDMKVPGELGMRSHLSEWIRFSALALGMISTVCFALPSGVLQAQEEGQKAAEEKSAEQAEEPEEDPFAVPEEASVEELFAFMDKVKRIPPPKRDYASVTEHAKKVFPAIIAAADVVLEKAEDEKVIGRAVSSKFEAYNILVRYDRSQKAKVDALAEKYVNHDNPAIARVAQGFVLSNKANSLRGATAEEAQALADEALEFATKFGMSRDTYAAVSGIARSMGYSDHPEIAADLYERLVPAFRESEDPSLQSRADTMLGAARRLRLMGNEMEVFGTTAAGEEFDWTSYRGKVVLVDFWASWCGPCLAELPNMKRNLETYGDRGFAIVGINMDSTRDKFEKCVEDKEISWVNLVSEDEGKTGWKAPMATHYGITGIPTAILVDQKGKVVSLRARGKELDKQLAELIGPPETTDESKSESSTDASQ